MSYEVIYRDGVVCLPAAAFLHCDDLSELRLLMLLSYDRTMAEADEATLCETLGCSAEKLRATVAALRDKGLMAPEKKLAPSVANKNFDGKQISDVMESDTAMKEVLDECQRICGKIFTPTDLSKIVAMKQELGYDEETILMLFGYYFDRLDAVGRKLTVSYVEKSAYSLYNQGIRTAEQFLAYIMKCEQQNSRELHLRKLFGTGERAFTKKEKRFFETWLDTWQMPMALLECAYEITVDSIGKPGLEYMSKILSDWHDSGVTTVEQAEKALKERRETAKYVKKFKETAEPSPTSSFNAEEFFEKALKRSYAVMSGSKKESDG